MIENLLEVGRHFQENSYEREVLEEGVTRLEVLCCGQGCSAVDRGAVQWTGKQCRDQGCCVLFWWCSALQYEGGKA